MNLEGNRAITDQVFWANYWGSKSSQLLTTISPDFLFSQTFAKFLPKVAGLELLEIGGFPGFFSIFFKKFYQYQTTLLDRYIDRKIIDDLCAINGVVEGVDIVEADIFNFKVVKQFDLVMSAGFIEHFTNLQTVIELHLKFLKSGGYLILAVPNFLGVNGFIQRLFDSSNYHLHNLDAMRFEVILPILKASKIEILHADYEDRFGVWLEEAQFRNKRFPVGLKRVSGVIRKLIPFESKLFSPYSLIIGRKP